MKSRRNWRLICLAIPQSLKLKSVTVQSGVCIDLTEPARTSEEAGVKLSRDIEGSGWGDLESLNLHCSASQQFCLSA